MILPSWLGSEKFGKGLPAESMERVLSNFVSNVVCLAWYVQRCLLRLYEHGVITTPIVTLIGSRLQVFPVFLCVPRG